MAEDEMIGRHHRFNGYELGQTLGDGEGQSDLECCSPWGLKRVGHNLATDNNNNISCFMLIASLKTISPSITTF